MKKFHSNLHRLQEIRQAVTSRCEADLAHSMRALEEVRGQHLQWKTSLAGVQGAVEKQSLQPHVPHQECLALRAWFQHLAACLHRTEADCQRKTSEMESRRENLKKAMMNQKVVENLALRERKEWMNTLHQAEQKEMDEAAAQCCLRRVIPPGQSSPE